jgi:hypothetical protein
MLQDVPPVIQLYLSHHGSQPLLDWLLSALSNYHEEDLPLLPIPAPSLDLIRKAFN